jgi:putative glutamine amidotransferase
MSAPPPYFLIQAPEGALRMKVPMRRAFPRAIVGIPASVRRIELGMAFHGSAEQYLRAVREEVGATAITIPGLSDLNNALEVLDLLDGVLLTGSFSNIHPSAYGESVTTAAGFYDEPRDSVTLPLIREAVRRGVPLFGICRGMQELNVAFGGSLFQQLHETEGNRDHRSDPNLPLDAQFEPAHEIDIRPCGVLAGLVGAGRAVVNSSHMQGVNRIGDGLFVEAQADDGVIEALSVNGARAFAVGVQFHPEWGARENPLYRALFQAFAAAVAKRAAGRAGAAER